MQTIVTVPILFSLTLCATAQSVTGPVPTEFEVVSIKPYELQGPNGARVRVAYGMRGGPGSSDPGHISWTGATLKGLIMAAYGVKNYQVTGPEWLDSDHYTVTAKVPAGATKEDLKGMWQKMLAERFGLKVHTETKEIPIYEIVPGKGPNKLRESALPPEPPKPVPAADGIVAPPPPPPPPPPPGGRIEHSANGCPVFPGGRGGTSFTMMPGRVQICASNISMDDLANLLTNQVSRPVFNKTGLTAKYDFTLTFEPDSQNGMMPPMPSGAALPSGAGGSGPDTANQFRMEPAPPIAAAFQNELGLKLEAKKAPANIVVVDQAIRTPTEN